ncbi:MAG: tRNA pseudouridine(55) synthase TruB [Candidatus Margulisbacteria bacterium]|nr:tRNA pseudouridine(55) synthase TruB [Candidatus Margulisiibacteriota bacterium]
MDGIIIVNKPKGWTSFDVVAKIRNLTRVKKVGHSGTLDPMATGVLPVFLGKATKSIQYFLNGDKGYNGEMVLGVRTDTGDAEGKIQTSNLQPQNKLQIPISKSQIEAIFTKYTGEIEQVPPMYSAVKIKGKKLYELARQGIEVKRQPRKINIYELRLTQNETPLATANRFMFSVLCSKGTYIRQLVMDIGDELGCGAHLCALERFYAHPFHVSQALDMETIVTLAKADILSTVILSPEEILDIKGQGG